MNADLLLLVVDHLADDYSTLFNLSLANKLCSAEAARLLYSRVLVLPKSIDRWMAGYPIDPFANSRQWSSAVLEKNAWRVRELVVSDAPLVDQVSFESQLRISFRAFKNLRSLEYNPNWRHPNRRNQNRLVPALSTEIIHELTSNHDVSLRRLAVDAQCLGPHGLDAIVDLRHLEVLTLHRPN